MLGENVIDPLLMIVLPVEKTRQLGYIYYSELSEKDLFSTKIQDEDVTTKPESICSPRVHFKTLRRFNQQYN